MNGLNLHFPSAVYYAYEIINMKEHQAIVDLCDSLKSDILEKTDSWCCDVLTSYNKNPLSDRPEFKTIKQAIINQIKIFCQSLDVTIKSIETQHMWVNSSGLGQYQEQHTHPNSSISAIYYLKAPKGSAKTIFKSPYCKQITLPSSDINANHITMNEVSYTAETGKLLLFESHLPHLTEQHKIEQERMTLAANFLVK